MILAAGEGTRLRPLTLSCPKPLAPVAGEPLLVRTLVLLRGFGIREVAVNTFHRAEAIRRALDDADVQLSPEEKLLGTAGGTLRMRSFLDTTFVVLYGDNYYRFDLAPLLELHWSRGALATLATFTTPDPTACGLVETDSEGRVTRFVEKPAPESVFTDQANAGVYILEPAIFEFISQAGSPDFGRDVFPALLAARPGAVFAMPLPGYLQDTGTPENYRQANWDALLLHSERAVAPSARLAPDAQLLGRNVVGANCRIETGAVVRESILWDDVTVAADARISGAVLGQGVVVGAGARIGEGSLLADGARVPAGMTLPPGTKLGPGEVAATQ